MRVAPAARPPNPVIASRLTKYDKRRGGAQPFHRAKMCHLNQTSRCNISSASLLLRVLPPPLSDHQSSSASITGPFISENNNNIFVGERLTEQIASINLWPRLAVGGAAGCHRGPLSSSQLPPARGRREAE